MLKPLLYSAQLICCSRSRLCVCPAVCIGGNRCCRHRHRHRRCLVYFILFYYCFLSISFSYFVRRVLVSFSHHLCCCGGCSFLSAENANDGGKAQCVQKTGFKHFWINGNTSIENRQKQKPIHNKTKAAAAKKIFSIASNMSNIVLDVCNIKF